MMTEDTAQAKQGRQNKMIGRARTAFLSVSLAVTAASGSAFGQAPPDHADAYYAFAMAHLNGELASAYGNRGEYVNKAIDFYHQAMKLDPSASYIGEELANFYAQVGQNDKAVQEATDLIKAHPDAVGPHRLLGRIYAKAIGDVDNGQVNQAMLKQAIAEYEKITELDPKDTESLSNLARLEHVAHDDAAAEKAYKAILAVDQEDGDAIVGLAIIEADKGDIAGAIKILKEAVDRNPDVRTVTTLAEVYEENKQFSDAADAWKMALPMTNDNIQVRRKYVTNLVQAGRAAEGLNTIESLSADDPKNTELLLQLMGIYAQQNDFAKADATLQKLKGVSKGIQVQLAEVELLKLEGKTPQAIALVEDILTQTKKAQYSNEERAQRISILDILGELQKKIDHTQEAVATYRQISELDPKTAPKVEVEVVATLSEARDFKAARITADAALKKYPDDRVVVMEHAGLLAELAQYDAALTELRAMPDANNDREIQVRIADVQQKAKRFADESKTLDRAEALSTNEGEKQALAFMRSNLYEGQKNFDGAEKQLQELIKADPNNHGALNYLGYLYADRNIKLDEAQRMISKALELDPGNGAYLDSLGWVYFRQNHLDQAADELRQALDKYGKDPTVHDHLGDVYFKQGKIREAIQQWEASVSGMKTAAPSEQDPEELAKVTRKLESAKVRVAQKQ